MSKPRVQEKVILFFAILYSKHFDIEHIVDVLKNKFGEILFASEISLFLETNYYNKEMGETIYRKFIFFENKVGKDTLVDVKKFSDSLEDKFLDAKKRTVNIDPGLFSKENIILATNKGFTHRVYLHDGVYADLTLYYKGASYQALDWTFREYKNPELIEMFNKLRKFILI